MRHYGLAQISVGVQAVPGQYPQPCNAARNLLHPFLGRPGLLQCPQMRILVQCQGPLTAENMPQPQLLNPSSQMVLPSTEATFNSTPRNSESATVNLSRAWRTSDTFTIRSSRERVATEGLRLRPSPASNSG